MTETYALLAVGGGPAGLAAARAYRQEGGGGAVALVADEQRMPYRRPPLTKELLRGESDESALPLEPESWLREHDVDLVCGRAVALDAAGREVTLSGGRALRYRHCVMATGAEPVRPPVPGADDPAVRVLRTLDHLRELQARLRQGDPVVVIGSGFIGCEIAASLRMRGHPVSLVSDEPAPNVRRLGGAAAAMIAAWLREAGVELALGAKVERIDRERGRHPEPGAERDRLLVRAGAHELRAPLVVMAAGVAPRGELAAAAGVDLHAGAIPVDPAMRTRVDGLLAAGDVAYAQNPAAGRALRVEHWGDALEQGAVAGRAAAGREPAWDAVPGFWSTIGRRTLKYAAWGDGFDAVSLEAGDGGFTAWYGREGSVVGVLAHERDDSYERGRELIATGAPWPPM
jgi:3-phenylpropionate/trans-cinnamate dioxygenase ferredoxin reductase subunit